MKVLLVNDYQQLIGGTEVYIQEIKAELQKRGHIVDIFTGDIKITKANKKSIQSLFRKQVFNLKYFLAFHRKLKNFKPDIVHLNSIFNELSPSLLLHLVNTPTIMTVHDSQLFSPVSMQDERNGKFCKKNPCQGCLNCVGTVGTIYEFIKRLIQKPMLRSIDLFIGNSKYINRCIEIFKLGDTRYIQFGVTLLHYSPIKNYRNILYIGRLSKEKGIQYVIEALPNIIQVYPDIKLIIVGNGQMKKSLLNMTIKLGMAKYIKYVNSIDHKDIQKVYEDSTFLVLPSIWEEPFGKVGIEAMSVGRPVLASRVGGIPEWLNDGMSGYLMNPRKATELSQKAIKLLSKPSLLARMSKHARKVSNDFTIEKHVTKLVNVYVEVQNRYKKSN